MKKLLNISALVLNYRWRLFFGSVLSIPALKFFGFSPGEVSIGPVILVWILSFNVVFWHFYALRHQTDVGWTGEPLRPFSILGILAMSTTVSFALQLLCYGGMLLPQAPEDSVSLTGYQGFGIFVILLFLSFLAFGPRGVLSGFVVGRLLVGPFIIYNNATKCVKWYLAGSPKMERP